MVLFLWVCHDIRFEEAILAAAVSRDPRYEAHENPPFLSSLGFATQFSVIASVTLLVTPVVVAKASSKDDSYLVWMVFASLLVAGVSTLVQVRRAGPVGAGAVLPMFTAAFSIPFCISAVVDGGPATLTALVIVCGISQIIISKWLFVLRRIITPTVGGTVLMILSITLASVVPRLLPEASEAGTVGAHLTALATLGSHRRAHTARLGGIASLGTVSRYRRGLRGCCGFRPLRCRQDHRGPLGRVAGPVAGVGA